MAPVTKRARIAAASSEARVVDPIAEKIDLISKTISNPACQVPGAESHREMLLVSIPHTFTVPSDERHEYQTQMAQMVGQVLSAYVGDWEKEVSESQANIGLSAQKSDESMKLVTESAGKIDAQEAEATKCKDIANSDSEAVKVAEEALESATKEVAEFDDKLQQTIVEKNHCSSIYNECFMPLKTGPSEATEAQSLTGIRKLAKLEDLQAMLKKLSTESSLLSAIVPTLKKSPSDRGTFDIMAVEGAEGMFTKHLGELQEQIDKADVSKVEKVSAENAAHEALTAATEKRTASEAVSKTADGELAALEASHKDLYAAASVASEDAEKSHAVLASKEVGLLQAKEVLGTFTELLERQSTVPEPAADVTNMVEDKLEAINEASPMELVAVA